MPWLKTSDKAAQHPWVLAVRRVIRADERSVNEVYGFVSRCATASAGYMTDYYVTLETAELYGQGRTDLLLRQAVAAGLLVAEGRGRARRWRLVEEDDLWHIRAREDVLWERQRDQDRRNPELTARVLLRDGDQCRYCRVVTTSAKDTRSGRGRTFDHLEPGQPATLLTYVVCCHRHNSELKNLPRAEKEKRLKPPPPLPYFSPRTTSRAEVEAFLGHPVQAANDAYTGAAAAATSSTSSGGSAAVGATSDRGHAAVGAHPTSPGSAAAGATLEHPGGAPPGPTTVEPPWSEGGRRDGSGRDWSGRVGPGSGARPAQSEPSRSRGSRGRRGGGGSR